MPIAPNTAAFTPLASPTTIGADIAIQPQSFANVQVSPDRFYDRTAADFYDLVMAGGKAAAGVLEAKAQNTALEAQKVQNRLEEAQFTDYLARQQEAADRHEEAVRLAHVKEMSDARVKQAEQDVILLRTAYAGDPEGLSRVLQTRAEPFTHDPDIFRVYTQAMIAPAEAEAIDHQQALDDQFALIADWNMRTEYEKLYNSMLTDSSMFSEMAKNPGNATDALTGRLYDAVEKKMGGDSALTPKQKLLIHRQAMSYRNSIQDQAVKLFEADRKAADSQTFAALEVPSPQAFSASPSQTEANIAAVERLLTAGINYPETKEKRDARLGAYIVSGLESTFTSPQLSDFMSAQHRLAAIDAFMQTKYVGMVDPSKLEMLKDKTVNIMSAAAKTELERQWNNLTTSRQDIGRLQGNEFISEETASYQLVKSNPKLLDELASQYAGTDNPKVDAVISEWKSRVLDKAAAGAKLEAVESTRAASQAEEYSKLMQHDPTVEPNKAYAQTSLKKILSQGGGTPEKLAIAKQELTAFSATKISSDMVADLNAALTAPDNNRVATAFWLFDQLPSKTQNGLYNKLSRDDSAVALGLATTHAAKGLGLISNPIEEMRRITAIYQDPTGVLAKDIPEKLKRGTMDKALIDGMQPLLASGLFVPQARPDPASMKTLRAMYMLASESLPGQPVNKIAAVVSNQLQAMRLKPVPTGDKFSLVSDRFDYIPLEASPVDYDLIARKWVLDNEAQVAKVMAESMANRQPLASALGYQTGRESPIFAGAGFSPAFLDSLVFVPSFVKDTLDLSPEDGGGLSFRAFHKDTGVEVEFMDYDNFRPLLVVPNANEVQTTKRAEDRKFFDSLRENDAWYRY